MQASIGIIGGSGLYQMACVREPQEIHIPTPFGATSDPIVVGTVGDSRVAFLARHGRGHRLLPSEVPYRANIYALKSLGVRYLLSFSAVGSLCEHMAPLDFVVPDQYIDLTKQRSHSFFGDGAVAHVSVAQPVCAALAYIAQEAVAAELASHATAVPAQPSCHRGATYVCIEGPQFSSLAESHWFQSMGAHIIGMTNMPEAKLAREAQIAYASICMVTDYDCWHPREAHVSADEALRNLLANAQRAQHVAERAIGLIAKKTPSSVAHTALQGALVTAPESMSEAVRARLDVIIRAY
jgi:5'-methylthioadenosine phosphorylase